MNAGHRSDHERVADVLDSIDRIRREASDHATFASSELVRVFVQWHIQLIGEALNSLSRDVRERNPDIPWRQIIGMRHRIVHGYHDIDPDLVWNVVEDHLDELADYMKSIRFNEDED